MKSLVIVESPTKAKTIGKFLGPKYRIESSFGHVRDLPKRKLGVDTEHDFTPDYVVPLKSKKTVTALKKLAAKAPQVYYATDEDREGEAIAWHLSELLQTPPEKTKRITFHEITKHAIETALEHPRGIDAHLVDAQQARRILDRLVGYELSPLLWKKVARGLSAGRVQSVAVRLIVEREREIKDFKPVEYWTVSVLLHAPGKTPDEFSAKLVSVAGSKIEKLSISAQAEADQIVSSLHGASYRVESIEQKTVKRNPPAPFTTSTLQQETNNRFGWSAKQTMYLAQQLYEGVEAGSEGQIGLITYMRTDSVNLSDIFRNSAKEHIASAYGPRYAESRAYATKSKTAQEAHEAIRPTEAARAPEAIKKYLEPKLWKLYDLVWRRAIASQMAAAELKATTIEIAAADCIFRASGSVLDFDGFLKVYPTKQKDELLPQVSEGDALELRSLVPEQHFTEPPPRYSEATLVKTLEEYGIGRPSTYAPTIATIQDRNYVAKDGRTLMPTEIAYLVNDLLVEHFPAIIDYSFTAKMEDDLDAIANGERAWVPTLKEFYQPFKKLLDEKTKTLSKKEITEETTDQICEKCGKPMVIKMGRFGRFLACTGFPECRNTKQLENGAPAKASPVPTDQICESCGAPMVQKVGRFGPFLSCSRYPECKAIKSITVSTGVKCPKCKDGDIIERRSKRGRTFYGCSQYPKCDFALWNKPTGDKCPSCGSLLVSGAKGVVRCSNKECEWKQE